MLKSNIFFFYLLEQGGVNDSSDVLQGEYSGEGGGVFDIVLLNSLLSITSHVEFAILSFSTR